MKLKETSIELLSIPDVNAKDLSKLVELINSVYLVAEVDFWCDGYLRTNTRIIEKAIGNSEIITANWQGELVACVHVIKAGANISKFGMLSVPPRFEGKGIGSRLVSAAEAHALNSGSRKMRLDLLTPVDGEHSGKQLLKEWYLRLGYEFIKQVPFEKVVPEEAVFLKMPCFFNLYEKDLGD